MTPVQTWSAESYDRNARFVSNYGIEVLQLLSPQPGETILDLGCGDGVLTEKIAGSGARVVGVDSSHGLLAAARGRGLDVRQMDGHALTFHEEFNAVFSNAALHWMLKPGDVIAGVAGALRPGGRFVGEMGGFGNVAAIATALRAVFWSRRLPVSEVWYYPTIDEYTEKLQAAGFVVNFMALIPRPTPLPTGMHGWLETFRSGMLTGFPEAEQTAITNEAVELLRPSLCDSAGRWTADYVRLRFAASKPG